MLFIKNPLIVKGVAGANYFHHQCQQSLDRVVRARHRRTLRPLSTRAWSDPASEGSIFLVF
jgi:hypothetical protein